MTKSQQQPVINLQSTSTILFSNLFEIDEKGVVVVVGMVDWILFEAFVDVDTIFNRVDGEVTKLGTSAGSLIFQPALMSLRSKTYYGISVTHNTGFQYIDNTGLDKAILI